MFYEAPTFLVDRAIGMTTLIRGGLFIPRNRRLCKPAGMGIACHRFTFREPIPYHRHVLKLSTDSDFRMVVSGRVGDHLRGQAQARTENVASYRHMSVDAE